jgi:xanthine dehydrogenase molybdopterin-binding subunit B
VGGREPLIVDYDVGFDDNGKITGITYKVYMEVRRSGR